MKTLHAQCAKLPADVFKDMEARHAERDYSAGGHVCCDRADSRCANAIPLGRYADRDDAPGGVVIAFLIFIAAALLAAWMVKRTET